MDVADTKPHRRPTVLLTGATGYVGGRLLPALLAEGHAVRCLVRRPESFVAPPGVEVAVGDVLEPETLRPALEGIETAYYLIHLMGDGGDFEARDRLAAENFSRAAREAGVRRIIYLGGLAEASPELSRHMRSRLEVGEILRGSGVPAIEFRASIIIGAGSLSFEIMRALVERVPVMTPPRWVRSLCQPISIHDVVAYLTAAARLRNDETHVFEVGGADQVPYQELMAEYGRRRGLRRLVIPVPLLTSYLSGLWLALITPGNFRVGRRLIESLGRVPTVVRDRAALEAFDVKPIGIREAIARALEDEDRWFAATSWMGAIDALDRRQPYGGYRFGPRFVDSHVFHAGCRPQASFRPIQRIGGEVGWYYGTSLWKLRGFIDRVLGGPGLKRGRKRAGKLASGDNVDFWCVEVFEPGRRLRFAADMKLPGRGWLDFEARGEDGGARIRATAIFDPKGLFGLLYWYAVYPIHGWLFRGMLRRIASQAEKECELEWATEEEE